MSPALHLCSPFEQGIVNCSSSLDAISIPSYGVPVTPVAIVHSLGGHVTKPNVVGEIWVQSAPSSSSSNSGSSDQHQRPQSPTFDGRHDMKLRYDFNLDEQVAPNVLEALVRVCNRGRKRPRQKDEGRETEN